MGRTQRRSVAVAFNTQYHTSVHTSQGNHWGLPHQRKRIYIAMGARGLERVFTQLKSIIEQESIKHQGMPRTC